MRKGFSLVELSVVISCLGTAFYGAGDKVGFSNLTSQLNFAQNHARNYVDADRYLNYVADQLKIVNERS